MVLLGPGFLPLNGATDLVEKGALNELVGGANGICAGGIMFLHVNSDFFSLHGGRLVDANLTQIDLSSGVLSSGWKYHSQSFGCDRARSRRNDVDERDLQIPGFGADMMPASFRLWLLDVDRFGLCANCGGFNLSYMLLNGRQMSFWFLRRERRTGECFDSLTSRRDHDRTRIVPRRVFRVHAFSWTDRAV